MHIYTIHLSAFYSSIQASQQGLGMPLHLPDSNKGERRPAATSTIYHYVSVWYSEQQSAHRNILRLFIHTLSRCPGNQQPV